MANSFVADPDVLKRLDEIEHPSGPVSRETLAVRVSYLLRLTRALLESQGELLSLAQDAEGYYNNRMGDCACYKSCPRCEAWDKKQRAAREVIARAERVRRGEV